MRIRTAVAATVAVVVTVALASSTLLAQSKEEKAGVPTAVASTDFTALKNVEAVPMASTELDRVRGLHVHFFTPSKNVVDTPFGPIEGIHLAGDIKTENNWSAEWGGSDLQPVAPSYKGLCKATGLSGPGAGVVSIPQGYQQCPMP